MTPRDLFFDNNRFSRTDKTYSPSMSHRASALLSCRSNPMNAKASFFQFHCPVTSCDVINLLYTHVSWFQCSLIVITVGMIICVWEVMKSYKPELFALEECFDIIIL